MLDDWNGLVDGGAKYLSVHDAATKSGLADRYKEESKKLSKFLHPTALSVLVPRRDDLKSRWVRDSAELGELMAAEALGLIAQARQRLNINGQI